MLSRTLVKLSVLYFLLAIVLGNFMGITQNFSFKHVHVHIAVLGWLSLAVVGLLYRAFPELERGWMPKAHAWLHNVGLVVFMGAFACYAVTGVKLEPAIGGGALLLSLGIILLAVNVLTRLGRPGT